MKCKTCMNDTPQGAIFCPWCGERQIKERKKKDEIKVPAPTKRADGTYSAQLMVRGKRLTVSGNSEKEYYANARAYKSGVLATPAEKPALTLEQACKNYIARRDGVKSPSTINGYTTIARTRFQPYMQQDVFKIDYQMMINDEAKTPTQRKKDKPCNAKTLKNAWGFIKSAIAEAGVDVPKVSLPQIVPRELPWLEPEQIPIFLNAIYGKPVELAALFALHGLRRSELAALTPADIEDGVIHVRGAAVRGVNGIVIKDTTKNESSRRDVKIRIPRLQELLDADERPKDQRYITTNLNSMHGDINRYCRKAGLPEVGVHGLRRSFASLAYSLGWSEKATMKEGGWSDRATMDAKYIKLAERDREKQSDAMTEFYKNLSK